MTVVRYHRLARDELRRAINRYERERRGLGEEFADLVDEALERVRRLPEHGSPYLAGTRRIVLGRFPFSLVYRVRPDEVIIIAVAHHRRRPGYWIPRL